MSLISILKKEILGHTRGIRADINQYILLRNIGRDKEADIFANRAFAKLEAIDKKLGGPKQSGLRYTASKGGEE